MKGKKELFLRNLTAHSLVLNRRLKVNQYTMRVFVHLLFLGLDITIVRTEIMFKVLC